MKKSKRHIGARALAAYLTESAIEGRREEIAEHILACSSCRVRLETLALTLAPRYRGRVTPDPGLRQRILDSYDERLSGKPATKKPAPGRRFAWLIPVTAAAGICAVAAGALLVWLQFFRPVPYQLSVKATSPGVLVGAGEVQAGAPVRAGAVITVPDEGAIELAAGEDLSIRLMSGSRFTLNTIEKEPRGPRVTLTATLRQGALLSSVPRKDRVRYTYVTPRARVESVGTEFLLMDDGASTEIIMKSGRVTLVPAATGKTLTAMPEMRYTVTRTVERAPVTDDDRERLQSFVTRHEERIQGPAKIDRERDEKQGEGDARSIRERGRERVKDRLLPRAQKRRDAVKAVRDQKRREGVKVKRDVKRRDEGARPPRAVKRHDEGEGPPSEVSPRGKSEGPPRQVKRPAADEQKKLKRERPDNRAEKREKRERPPKKDR